MYFMLPDPFLDVSARDLGMRLDYHLYGVLPPLQLFHAEGQAWVYNHPLSKRLKELNI